MSLNKKKLEGQLNDLYKATLSGEGNQDDAQKTFVRGLANIIDEYVKSVEVQYTVGLIAPSGGGPVTGEFGHKIL